MAGSVAVSGRFLSDFPDRTSEPRPNGSLVDSQYEIPFRNAQERIRRQIYRTREEAKADIFDYIEVFYNRKRRHAYLGYVSPVEFEKRAVGLN